MPAFVARLLESPLTGLPRFCDLFALAANPIILENDINPGLVSAFISPLRYLFLVLVALFHPGDNCADVTPDSLGNGAAAASDLFNLFVAHVGGASVRIFRCFGRFGWFYLCLYGGRQLRAAERLFMYFLV